ncbi:LytR/AlgR family response regulator transcription factor [Spongiimicrobium sp. 3-5]|uniref:LytR/AlgR family response regulator transcription factor n=1 Tax=Spongiimicrobium sp. 3-5 TaxID=3332596 RepID=UPI00397F9D70
MKNVLNDLPKYSGKWSFKLVFLLFLLFFSMSMAALIYWKEDSFRNHVYFIEVLFWQIMIWLPWYFFIPIVEKGLKKVIAKNGFLRYASIVVFFIVLIALHWAWFVFYSSFLSPYIDAPQSRYGVFQYFFIFWTLIDFVLLMAISAYFTLYKTKSETATIASTTIQVKRGNKKILLKFDSVYWISAEGYYALLYSDQGQFLLRRSLKDLIETLPNPQFIRIHRSAIININHLNEVQQSSKNGINAIMKDGKSHPVSRTYIKDLREVLKNTSI